jgi:hypothetical protein
VIGYIDKEEGFSCAFAECQAGRVFVGFHNVPADEVGRKYLLAGEEIEFELVPNAARGRIQSAENVRILTPREPVDIHTYREAGTITQVGPYGDYGFVKREFHCASAFAFLHYKQQMPGSPRLAVGQVYEYGVAPPAPGKNTWKAVGALWLADSEKVAA